MLEEQNQVSLEEFKKILEENLKLSQEIQENTKYIKKYVIWSQVFGVIKVLLIVVPIVLGILYLPSLLGSALAPYKELLQIPDQASLKEAAPTLLKEISPELLRQKK